MGERNECEKRVKKIRKYKNWIFKRKKEGVWRIKERKNRFLWGESRKKMGERIRIKWNKKKEGDKEEIKERKEKDNEGMGGKKEKREF